MTEKCLVLGPKDGTGFPREHIMISEGGYGVKVDFITEYGCKIETDYYKEYPKFPADLDADLPEEEGSKLWLNWLKDLKENFNPYKTEKH